MQQFLDILAKQSYTPVCSLGIQLCPDLGTKADCRQFISSLACYLYPFVTERTVDLALSLMSRSTLLLLGGGGGEEG